jgi:hypothetical protein
LVVVAACHYMGVFTHLWEVDYALFKYPLEGDVSKWAEQLRVSPTFDQ